MRRKGKHAKKLMCIHELCVFACVFISVCLCRSWSNLLTWQSMDVCRVYLNTYVISLTYADRARKAMCSTYLCMFLSCDLCSCLLLLTGFIWSGCRFSIVVHSTWAYIPFSPLNTINIHTI